ncbi:hypothetical protein HK405_015038, partial [Cladochytrium tenue]
RWIEAVRAVLPETLDARRSRVAETYSLAPDQVEILMDEPGAVEFFEEAKHTLELMLDGDTRPARDIASSNGWLQSNDEAEIRTVLAALIEAHPGLAAEVRAGKHRKLKFFAGEAMRATRGRANPHITERLLRELLGVPPS